MKVLLFVLVFALGVGAGWLLFRCRDVPDAGNGDTARTGETWPSAGADTVESNEFKGIPIRLQRAWELGRNYRSGVHVGRPKTEAVIHDLASLKAYLTKIEELAEEAQAHCSGCTTAVAFYFGESYNGSYLLKKDSKKAYLLKDNNTVFLMPYFYNEKDSNVNFKYIEEGNTIKLGTEMVKRIDKFWDPLDEYDPKLNWASQKFSSRLKRFFEETEGFDLGHTKP